ncbi:MAG: hypothetical protein SGBAC_002593 [Bacillariaceae sp.]
MSTKYLSESQDLERRLSNMAAILRERDEEINSLKLKLAESKRGKNSKSSSLRIRRGSVGKSSKDKSHESDDSTSGRRRRGSVDANDNFGCSGDEGKPPTRSMTSFSHTSIMKPVGKAVRGSVGILDYTVDIGRKAGKVVLKSTGKTGMKVGRMLGFKTERRKRLSSVKAKNALTKWDNAVEIIDQMLEDDGNGLDAEEKNGLRDIQDLLLRGMENEVEKTYHIPINLLEDSNGSQRLSLSAKSYVLKEYGGITKRQPRPGLLRQDGIRGSATRTLGIEEDWDDSVPSEFINLEREQRCKIYEMCKWDNLKNWDFDIFALNEVSDGHPLVLMGWAILGAPHAQRAMAKSCDLLDNCSDEEFLKGYNFVESEMKIPMDKLCLYLRLVEDNYRENPYHNAVHAADVVQSLNALIQMAGTEIKADDEELFSILLAAVVHDVDHPGMNNSYQVTARTNLSLQYNDISVLENYHASKAFTMMIKSSPFGDVQPEKMVRSESVNLGAESDFDILCNLNSDQFAAVKSKTIDAILHTDMKLHFQTVSKIKGVIMSEEKQGEADTMWDILTFMLHMADISNAAKPGAVSRQWTERCLEEFFEQGDQEKKLGMEPSPQCDRDTVSRPDSQIGFIQFVVLPAYEVLACIIPELKTVAIPQLEQNRQYWEAEAMMREQDEDSTISPNTEHEHSITESTDDFSIDER